MIVFLLKIKIRERYFFNDFLSVFKYNKLEDNWQGKQEPQF